MISERTLRKWREDALVTLQRKAIHRALPTDEDYPTQVEDLTLPRDAKRILQLTQELIDQHLLIRREH